MQNQSFLWLLGFQLRIRLVATFLRYFSSQECLSNLEVLMAKNFTGLSP